MKRSTEAKLAMCATTFMLIYGRLNLDTGSFVSGIMAGLSTVVTAALWYESI